MLGGKGQGGKGEGRALITTPAAQTPVAAGGGVLMGSLDLTGLPPGMYRLVLVAGAGGDTVTRAGAFRMGGFEAEQHVPSAVQAEAEPTHQFSRLSSPHLHTSFPPLPYLAPPPALPASTP